MAKKRVEEAGTVMNGFETKDPNATEVMLDINPSDVIPRQITPQSAVPENTVVTPHPTQKQDRELINCLRNERVIVRFVPKETAMIHNKDHILYGGMAENATRNFVVPRLRSTGLYKNVLTNNEMAYLEHVMGLEPGTMSIYKQHNNFWDDSNEGGIGRVTLHKQDNYFDLSNPADYIKVKILLANNDKIAPSMQELEDRPKATYEFVIVSEDAETKSNLSKMEATAQCYMEFGAVKNDKDTLRVIIELLEKRAVTPQVKLDYLQSKVNEYIQKDSRRFLQIITDTLLPAKVLIKRAQEAGLVSCRNNSLYYLRDGNLPLCEAGEESTLTVAAKYITAPKHSDIKYLLEAKLKEE